MLWSLPLDSANNAAKNKIVTPFDAFREPSEVEETAALCGVDCGGRLIVSSGRLAGCHSASALLAGYWSRGWSLTGGGGPDLERFHLFRKMNPKGPYQ